MKQKIIAAILIATMISIPPIHIYAETIPPDTISLRANESINDFIEFLGESDYFSFVMPGSGYVSFTIKNTAHESNYSDGWQMYIYDSSGNEIGHYYNPNDEAFESSGRFNFRKGDKLYIKVDPKYASTVNKVYSITANYTNTSSWESEKNDDFSSATYLAAGKARCGTSYKSKDEDYYFFKAAKNGKIKLNFSLATALKEKNEKLNAFSIRLYDSSKNEICEPVGRILNNKSMVFNVKAGKKYYIHISSEGTDSVDALYKIKVSYKK